MFLRRCIEDYVKRIDNRQLADRLASDIRTYLLFDDPELSRTRWQRIKWNIFRVLTFAIYFTEYLRFGLILSNSNGKPSSNEVLNVLGDMLRFFNGPLKFYAIGASLCLLVPVIMSTTVTLFSISTTLRQVLIEVYKPIKVISGDIEPSEIGLTNLDATNLRIHLSIALDVIGRPSMFTSIGMPVYLTYMAFTKIDLNQHLLGAIIGSILMSLFARMAVTGMTIALIYFYITCHVLTMRIENWSKELSVLQTREATSLEIKRLLRHHNEIAVWWHQLNSFWSKYVFAIYLAYLPLGSIILFFIIMVDQKLPLFCLFVSGLCQIFTLLTFACLSASGVSREVSLEVM